jgi:hypothetical protein
VRRAVDWWFRSRETGRITVGQWPNLSLWIFIVAWTLRRLLDPTGTVDTVLAVVATAALVVWALDELIRGVNPWRRLLGATVLTWQVLGLLA